MTEPTLGPRPSRAGATAERRRAILDAALDCFTEQGFQRTTMEQIRDRAGASTGSLYHHFESKEVLAGELYLEGTRRVQEEGLSALLKHRSAERGIRAIVSWYLRWVQDNPKFASYLFDHRHADFMVRDRRLERMNMKLRSDVTAWLGRHIEAGELPKMSMEMYWAVLVGPCEFVCRRRIREGRPEEIARSARELGDAAWGAIVEIRDRRKRLRRRGRSSPAARTRRG